MKQRHYMRLCMTIGKRILPMLFMCLLGIPLMAQLQEIKGKVTDSKGIPLPFANVLVKGTTTGSLTDDNGTYSITLPSDIINPVLVFSSIGFTQIEQAVGTRTVVDVSLSEEMNKLEEIVIVGFGTQKKENLTGAVATVNVDRFLAERPIPDVARGLQGAVAGLTITSSTGELGSSPNINIRGSVGSPNGKSNPLILVDNVVIDDLGMINPDDIASISVLKDAASSSIYGARAAFGVILITTKGQKIKNKTSVMYSNNFAWRTPTTLPDQLSGWQQAEINLAAERRLDPSKADFTMVGTLLQDDASIAKMKEWEQKYGGQQMGDEMEYGRDFEIIGGKQYYYRTWDWREKFYKDWMPQQTHNVSINTGGEKTSAFIGLGYLSQDGLTKMNADSYDRYNANMNVNSKAYSWLDLRLNTMFSKTIRETPFVFNSTNQGLYDYLYYLYRWQPFYPYGTLDGKPFRSAITELQQAPRNRNEQIYSRLGGGATFHLIEGLTVDADFNYSNTSKKSSANGGPIYALDFWSVASLDALRGSYRNYLDDKLNFAEKSSTRTELFTTNVYATYSKRFKEVHSFKLIAGTNMETSETEYLYGKRMKLYDANLPELNLAYGDPSVNSTHSHWSVMGYFARINYDYKGKYLLEGNIRYDGSSAFPTKTQWGTFPSFSVGWRITEEKFAQGVKPILSDLKFRGSYGSIGNQNVGQDAFLSLISMNSSSNWLINGQKTTSVNTGMPTALSPGLTWEKVTTIDIGFDARFFNNALGITFDWYRRTTSNLLSAGDQLPETYGLKSPKTNFGELQTPGWELSVDYNHQFSNGIGFFVSGQLTDYYTKVSKWSKSSETATVPLYSPDAYNADNFYEGMVLGDIWGFKVDRLFQETDFNADGTYKEGVPSQILLQSGQFIFGPGDVKYQNLDGDDKISYGDKTIAKPGDKTIIGNLFPRMQFGVNVGLNYKGFDLSVFFQGVGKRKLWAGGNVVLPGMTSGEPWFDGAQDYWTKDNTGAFYPRPTVYGQGLKWNYEINDRYLLDMFYVRCKSLTLGYTLPKTLINKFYINNLRVYFTGENLFELTNLNVPIDPETGITKGTNDAADVRNYGRSYPYQRTLSVGLQVSF